MSPCQKICVVDPLRASCIGCGRTVEEISQWREMPEAERLAILAQLPARMRATRMRAARTGRARARYA